MEENLEGGSVSGEDNEFGDTAVEGFSSCGGDVSGGIRE